MNAKESLRWSHFVNDCIKGHKDVVIMYINWSNIDMNVKDILEWTHFKNACRNGHKYVVKSLQNSSICSLSEIQDVPTSFGLFWTTLGLILGPYSVFDPWSRSFCDLFFKIILGPLFSEFLDHFHAIFGVCLGHFWRSRTVSLKSALVALLSNFYESIHINTHVFLWCSSAALILVTHFLCIRLY